MTKKLLPLLAAAVILLTGCAKSQPKSISFAVGESRYITASGAAGELSMPALAEGGSLYLPREAFSLFSETLPEGVTLGEEEYLPVSATAESLGLFVVREGGVFCVYESGAEPLELAASAESLGYSVSEPEREALQLSAGIFVDPYVTYTYEQMLTDIEELTAAYPGLVSAYSFGESEEGRKLMALELGRGPKRVLINASVHGCESFSTSFAMFLIDRYANAYATGEAFGGGDARALLDEVTFVFSVMLNPDGVNIAQNGITASDNYENLRRMSMKDTGWWGWKTNSNGVDINRNFPFNWWQSNYDRTPGARYYHGPEAASESETQAMVELLSAVPYSVLVDLHLYGEQVDWIDSGTLHKSQQYRPLADELMTTFGYDDWGVEDVSSFGGYLVNYARNTYDAPAILLELTNYWRCPQNLFDSETEKLWCLLHILGRYAVGNGEVGYSLVLNGEEISSPACRERAITVEQLSLLLDGMGAGCIVSDTGVEISANGETWVFIFEETAEEGAIYAAAEDGYVLLQPLLRTLGAAARLSDDGSALLVEYFA